jgi:catechol 2,3-dioxygenase-like lactoylglutathione lyase family enzyme
MNLGIFSMSLAVKDLSRSRAFYEKIGFQLFYDGSAHHYLIMKNGSTIIGLFKGMFEGNILTFNPGWDENAGVVEGFDDIRKIQRAIIDNGISIETPVDENGSGPASFTLKDPDGNTILFDQHV